MDKTLSEDSYIAPIEYDGVIRFVGRDAKVYGLDLKTKVVTRRDPIFYRYLHEIRQKTKQILG